MCRAGLIVCPVLVLWTAPFVWTADDPKEPVPTAWGKPVKGLQAGVRVNVGPKGLIPPAVMHLEVVVRNVSKEALEFDHMGLIFGGENTEGTVTAKGVVLRGGFAPEGTRSTARLAPGESYRLATVPIFRPGEGGGWVLPTPKVRIGENRIGAEGIVVRLAGAKEVELATGYLDVQITPPKK